MRICSKITSYLRPLDDDCVGGKVNTPGQCCRGDENLNVLVIKEFLHEGAVHSGHAGIVDSKAIGQEVLQFTVLWGASVWVFMYNVDK